MSTWYVYRVNGRQNQVILSLSPKQSNLITLYKVFPSWSALTANTGISSNPNISYRIGSLKIGSSTHSIFPLGRQNQIPRPAPKTDPVNTKPAEKTPVEKPTNTPDPSSKVLADTISSIKAYGKQAMDWLREYWWIIVGAIVGFMILKVIK